MNEEIAREKTINELPTDRNMQIISRSLSLPSVTLRMKKLRHLDVSQWNDSTPSHIGTFSNPSAILTRLLDSLPELKSLDLSGTNLPSQTTDASQEDSALLKCFYTKHDIKTLKVSFVLFSVHFSPTMVLLARI